MPRNALIKARVSARVRPPNELQPMTIMVSDMPNDTIVSAACSASTSTLTRIPNGCQGSHASRETPAIATAYQPAFFRKGARWRSCGSPDSVCPRSPANLEDPCNAKPPSLVPGVASVPVNPHRHPLFIARSWGAFPQAPACNKAGLS